MEKGLSLTERVGQKPVWTRKRAMGGEQEYGILGFWNNFPKDAFLENGARLYVDCDHPEYSSPETSNPLDAVLYDKAGEVICQNYPRRGMVRLFKNNTDDKGSSYASHENYCIKRTPIEDVLDLTLGFFVTRIILSGSGTIRGDRRGTRYEISQKAGHTADVFSQATTYHKPIFNCKDETLGDEDKYRRLHMVCGDANMSEIAIFLKFGMTCLVLDLYEDGLLKPLTLRDPLEAFHAISRDLSLTQRYQVSTETTETVYTRKLKKRTADVHVKINAQFLERQIPLRRRLKEIKDREGQKYEKERKGINLKLSEIGNEKKRLVDSEILNIVSEVCASSGFSRFMTAVEIQRHYLEAAEVYRGRDEMTNDVLDRWRFGLDGLGGDTGKLETLDKWLDWRIKKKLIDLYMERWKGRGLWHEKVRDLDLQYHDINREKGLFYILRRRGLVDRLLTDEQIEHATKNPPKDTRAWIRGRAASAKNARVHSWNEVQIGSWCYSCLDGCFYTDRKEILNEPLYTYPEVDALLEFSTKS
jgi:hypothetical protein